MEGLEDLRRAEVTENLGDLSLKAEAHHKANDEVEITTFSESVDYAILHFQIIRLQKQLYVWIGCNSATLGHLVAAAPTRPKNAVSVANLIVRRSCDDTESTGSGIARRAVLKTGLNVVLACNIPKGEGSKLIVAAAEEKLVQKFFDLGYATPNLDNQS